MDKKFFTITGTQYRFGLEIFEKGMTVKLEKDPENEYDREAIKVSVEGLGQVGWVANSIRTVRGESFSAGRLYDKIGDTAVGKVVFVLPDGVLAVICEDEEEEEEPEKAKPRRKK